MKSQWREHCIPIVIGTLTALPPNIENYSYFFRCVSYIFTTIFAVAKEWKHELRCDLFHCRLFESSNNTDVYCLAKNQNTTGITRSSCHLVNAFVIAQHCYNHGAIIIAPWLLHCALASCGIVYCNRPCLCVCLFVCGSVTMITWNFVHRSSPKLGL